MRIFTDIATHDTAGVAPGGRIIRTDSSPEEGDVTPVNGKFIFTVPEGAALEIDSSSFYFPQEDADSIPSRTAAEFLIRYPMYDHILYNFYLDNEDMGGIDLAPFATLPDSTNTTPAYPSFTIVPPSQARCQAGRTSGTDVGMVPNSLAMLPRTAAGSNTFYGCILTETVDLWPYNPCYIDVLGPVPPTSTITIAGFVLTAVNGAPGVDEFDISSGNAVTIAANITNAINLGTNSFSGFVTATVDPTNPTRVQLRPVPASNTSVTLTAAANNIEVVESHPGTDEVMMWWKVGLESTTEDQGFAGQGPGAGENSPAIKSHTETNPEPPNLFVYASVDDGVSWFQIPYLEPVDLVTAGTELRLCFVNAGQQKAYLHGFCVLFPDLLPPL